MRQQVPCTLRGVDRRYRSAQVREPVRVRQRRSNPPTTFGPVGPRGEKRLLPFAPILKMRRMAYPNLLFHCLNCRNELSRRSGNGGFLYRCSSCQSFAASVPLLRKTLPGNLVNRLWTQAGQPATRSGRSCPLCEKAMAAQTSHQGQNLEVCRTCRIVWFDPGDYPGNRSDLEKPFRQNQLSPRAREAMAVAKVNSIRRRAEAKERRDSFINDLFRGIGHSAGSFFFRF